MARRRQSREPGRSVGGQVALTGFFYQILGNLGHMVERLDVAGAADVAALRDARLELVPEPATGGDLASHAHGRRVVIQYKSSNTPWTTGRIVRDVLPDLLRDAEGPGARQDTEWRLVSNAEFRADDLLAFADALRGVAYPAEPDAVLAAIPGRFTYGRGLTASGFFAALLDRMPGKRAAAPALWRLLSNFTVDRETEESLDARVDTMLGQVVDVAEELPMARRALIGRLFELARTGTPFSAAGLLNSGDIRFERFFHVRTLPGRLHRQLAQDLRNFRYEASLDVRPSPEIDTTFAHIVLGESGYGKSWRVLRIAHDLSRAGSLVILASGGMGSAGIEQRLIERLWLSGSYTGRTDLIGIARRLRGAFSSADDSPWLTLVVDDVRSTELLNALLDPRWREMGIRVVISGAGTGLDEARLRAVGATSETVGPFLRSEVRAFLRCRGRSWQYLPPDVLDVLAQPILARLFVELPAAEGWNPVDEYALIDRFWRHATSSRSNEGATLEDGDIARMVAAALLDPSCPYPVPVSATRRAGLDAGTRSRLEAAGVLRTVEDRVAFSHDRILNWAMAGYLADQTEIGALRRPELVQHLAKLLAPDATGREASHLRRLAYVPMDVLWLLARRLSASDLAELLHDLLIATRPRLQMRGFFAETLPTLGASVLPALAALAEREDIRSLIQRTRIADAIKHIARQAPGPAVACLGQLFESSVEAAREEALLAMEHVAVPDSLDELRRRHRDIADQRALAPEMSRRAELSRAARMHVAAMERAVAADPDWLDQAIGRATEADHPDTLAWLVTTLPQPQASPIWHRHRDRLLRIVQQDRRHLARAALHVRDRDAVGWLVRMAEAEDEFDMACRFSALVRLAPAEAMALLPSMPRQAIPATAHDWLGALRHRTGDAGHAAIRRWLPEGWPSDRDLAVLFLGDPDLLDQASLDRIARCLEDRLGANENDPDWEPQGEGHLIRCLAGVRHPDLLDRLAALRGGRLAGLLARRAAARTGPIGLDRDSDGAHYRRILLAIGGDDLGRLALAELERANPFGRRDGLETVLWQPDLSRQRLRELAVVPEPNDVGRSRLARVLAALDETDALAALARTLNGVEYDLLDLREGRPPFSDAVTTAALIDLTSQVAEERDAAVRVLLLSNRPEAKVPLANHLLGLAPADPATRMALEALRILEHYGAATIAMAGRIIDHPECRQAAANYLLGAPDGSGTAALTDFLERQPRNEASDLGMEIALALLQRPDAASVARTYLDRWSRHGFRLHRSTVAEALAAAGDPTAHDDLELLATRPDRGLFPVGAGVFRQLAQRDGDLAFEAVVARFDSQPDSGLPDLLVEMDSARALPFLLDRILVETVPSMRRAIGRVLRRWPDAADIDTLLQRLADDPQPDRRSAAAELAGWLEPPRLEDMLARLADDIDLTVEAAALAALRRRRDFLATRQLLARFGAATASDAWAFFLSAMDLIDADLAVTREDPLALWPCLEPKPRIFLIEANRLLREKQDRLGQADRDSRSR